MFAVGCQLAGVVGVLATETGTSSWYEALNKPFFQPPGWVFGPVWTLLYTLMGIAAWRIWRQGADKPGVRPALCLFGAQLLLNAIWSPVFFGAHAIGSALVVLIALWAVLLVTMIAFARLDTLAGRLLLPYHLWVTFATVLNAAIVRLN